MNDESMTSFFIGILICTLVGLMLITIGSVMSERIKADCKEQNFTGFIHYWDADVDCSQFIPDHDITYEMCCGGMTCSDTYYTYQDNLCHLVLCEQSLFTNKADCTYEGKT